MMSIDNTRERERNPLEAVEHMAIRNDLSFERSVEDEITLIVSGGRANYQISYTWMREIEVLHFACGFDLKVPEPRRAAVQQLIAIINEQLWIGHFDVWTHNGIVIFRHAMLLAGGGAASREQCEVALGSAVDCCERYYPAFQYVAWAGKSARDALTSVMFETCGDA